MHILSRSRLERFCNAADVASTREECCTVVCSDIDVGDYEASIKLSVQIHVKKAHTKRLPRNSGASVVALEDVGQ